MAIDRIWFDGQYFGVAPGGIRIGYQLEQSALTTPFWSRLFSFVLSAALDWPMAAYIHNHIGERAETFAGRGDGCC